MPLFSSKIIRFIINFISRSRYSLIGGVMVIILLPVLFVSILLDMQGVVENPYFGFLIYLVMGPMFIIGVMLLIGGIIFCRKEEDLGQLTLEYFEEELRRPGRFSRIRRLIFLTSFTTFITLFIVGLVTYTGFHYTNTVKFCGQFCHSVMEPEYVTYTNSPHSQVTCVECHIGASSEWVTKSKFSGARQLIAVLFDSYSRPIKTPITALRPERKTCENCHRPEVFHGDKLYVIDKFLPDEKNTHVQTIMLMKIGSGDYSGRKAQGIHWHISRNHEVSFVASEDHSKIYEVTFVDEDQEKTVYRRKSGAGNFDAAGRHENIMDCMDCHNRPTHVFLSPEEALDQKLVTGIIPGEIPFIKRQGLAAITGNYASQDVARRAIAQELMDWYRQEYPGIVAGNEDLLQQAVIGVQQAYVENVYPRMNIDWMTYTSHTGHQGDNGCFRCHNDEFVSDTGKQITRHCDACHIVLVEEEPAKELSEILRR
ncbi:MAG: NapC/NirT family cytochrome c [Desulfobulbaceae bacterium]|nr:NapC/NirT family cytochrome c [Desulfobulbaceae bacterium]